MMLKNNFWFFTGALSKETCEKIKSHCLTKSLTQGKVGIDELNLRQRKSKISWHEDRWLYETLQPFVEEANVNAEWKFQWDWSESIQFTEYQSPGEHYDWHADQAPEPYKNNIFPSFNGKIRKLSLILSLTDHRDYIGGDLQFDYGLSRIETCYEIKPQGSIVVFPSFLRHRVTPLFWGTRHSIVMWSLGKPWT
jgi:PKHD-type hydroxylase